MELDPTLPPLSNGEGTILNRSVKLLRKLGSGGMGTVYLGEQIHLRRSVAVKMLHPQIARDPTVFERFKREAQLCASLGNRHIIDVYDFNISEDGQPYIVMELLQGHDLEEELQKRGALEARFWVTLLLQICTALEATHRADIVHRDLKPSNIFLCHEVEHAPLLKILDFGISRARGSFATLTKTGEIFGTPHYMSPEVALGDTAAIDHRADLYALGTISYEVLSGQRPFVATSVPAILYAIVHKEPEPLAGKLSSIPPELTSIIAQLMSKDIDRRPSSAGELRDMLQGIPWPTDTAKVKGPFEPVAFAATTPIQPLRNDEDSSEGTVSGLELDHLPTRSRAPIIAILLVLFSGLAFSMWSLTREKSRPPVTDHEAGIETTRLTPDSSHAKATPQEDAQGLSDAGNPEPEEARQGGATKSKPKRINKRIKKKRARQKTPALRDRGAKGGAGGKESPKPEEKGKTDKAWGPRQGGI